MSMEYSALHEGSVTAMAGGYTQVRGEPAVMSVHLGAGLAQCLGQLINVWDASLPVVIITFHGDTGSFADRVSLDLSHDAGPTSISAPFTKANWTVIDPGGLPWAVERAIMVATTPPIGPGAPCRLRPRTWPGGDQRRHHRGRCP